MAERSYVCTPRVFLALDVSLAWCVCRLAKVPSPVVWTETGRVVGNLRHFAQLLFRTYGIVCDIDNKQLKRIATFNFSDCVAERARKQVCGAQQCA